MARRLPPPSFFMYSGPAFPSPDALLSCNGLRRLAPFSEPMAQFYSELGLHRALAAHPSRVHDPSLASVFYIPILPHMDQDAGRCNGTGHRKRMERVADALRSSPHWQRANGTDHFYACACVMMKSMLTSGLWSLLSAAAHAVHSVPRMRASPSACELTLPYYNPAFARVPEAPEWRVPGRTRPLLAHFRGRVMNRVRGQLVRAYGHAPTHLIQAAHPSTAARCNLNKCKPASMRKVNFSASGHFEEMKSATFCLVPVGDSPPSSRLYLAVAAGCIPVFISDGFGGAFPSSVPWNAFSLRFAEAQLVKGRVGSGLRVVNLTRELLAVAADPPRLHSMQAALQTHAVDVLWEAPGSRVGEHTLALAGLAIGSVCPEGRAQARSRAPRGPADAAADSTAETHRTRASVPAELLQPVQVRYDDVAAS